MVGDLRRSTLGSGMVAIVTFLAALVVLCAGSQSAVADGLDQRTQRLLSGRLMAAITEYLTNNSVSVGSDLSVSDPGAEAYRSPVTGWVVGTGSTNHSEWFNDVERASSTFTGTAVPDGTLDTTNGDFWVSSTPRTGSFASANWNIHFACRANTGPASGASQDGRIRVRLFRGVNQDGSSAVEITAAQQQGGLVTDLNSAATQVSTVTFNPGAFSLTAEYFFIQLAWERTGAGPMTTSDVNARIGNGSGTGCRVITSNFSAAYTFNAEPIAFTFTGVAIADVIGRVMNAAPRAFTFTGAPTSFNRGYLLKALPQAFVFTGAPATGIKALNLNAAPRSFVLTGAPVADVVGRVMNAAPRTFVFTGAPATLDFSGGAPAGPPEHQEVLMMRDVGKMMNRS